MHKEKIEKMKKIYRISFTFFLVCLLFILFFIIRLNIKGAIISFFLLSLCLFLGHLINYNIAKNTYRDRSHKYDKKLKSDERK